MQPLYLNGHKRARVCAQPRARKPLPPESCAPVADDAASVRQYE